MSEREREREEAHLSLSFCIVVRNAFFSSWVFSTSKHRFRKYCVFFSGTLPAHMHVNMLQNLKNFHHMPIIKHHHHHQPQFSRNFSYYFSFTLITNFNHQFFRHRSSSFTFSLTLLLSLPHELISDLLIDS